MKYIYLLWLLILGFSCKCQNRNSVWCFGNNAGINFSNLSQPTPFNCNIKTRGSCASIADVNFNLLFYAYTGLGVGMNTTLINNANNQLMINGTNVVGRGWYQELTITSNPGDSSKYYLFSIGATSIYGLYYSVVDMKLDSGRGMVTQKNVQLSTYPSTDCISSVKHGNGRDWWVIFRKNGYYAGWYDNQFYKYLVTPSGIAFADSQAIGPLDYTGFTRLAFNKTGNKLALVSFNGDINLFDFDRCTGNLFNNLTIRQGINSPPYAKFWSGEFSQNDRFLYISTSSVDTSYLIQIDLQNSQPWLNADTIWSNSTFKYNGTLKRGPNDKIYFATTYYENGTLNYPFSDTTFNLYNMNLSVINSPDSLGLACNFSPYSFYLGGARTYYGLPNNPDYDLPRLQGSVCDTVMWTGLTPNPSPMGEGSLTATYITDWQIAFINASGLKGKDCLLEVFDVQGKKVFEKTQQAVGGGYFTYDLNCNGFTKGMYLVSLSTDKEKLRGKFVKE